MAGIKIHQYPLERTSIGDEDYYDIDYWTGSSYQSAKIKGSTLKNVLGADYIDITAFISGYELTDKDAGKLITNSNTNVRTLVIPSGLALPNNMVTVKGRIAIQPEIGVNITLPDGSIITDPSQFTCVADEVYILHKSAFSGDDYILVSLKKSENIGTNDLIITDTIRELQVATDGTFQIVTNDPNNSTLFKVGENSNERFGGIEINSVTYDKTTAEPNPTNNGAGIITRINPNEYEVESRSDIGDSGTKRSRIYTSPNEVVLEKSSAGKLTLNSLGASNTFEDLRATKKGLEYFADYSANFSVRSLVDKGYVDNAVSGVPTLYANNGTVGSTRVVTLTDTLSFSGGRVSFDTTTNGILLPRLTTLQMNAIATPSTNELVFNTDLNGLYRYNGSSWVALSSGYGIIGVYSGSGSGAQTFFADLQSALETCKASGGYFTVKLYSNITITSAIEIYASGSGVGRAYAHRQITIDFNGFSLTNSQANGTHCFVINPTTTLGGYQEIRMINGNVFRINNTSSGRAILMDNGGFGTLQMSKMFVHAQNGETLVLDVNPNTTAVGVNRTNDLGWSTLSNETAYALVSNNTGTQHTIENFKAISSGSVQTIDVNSAWLNNFRVQNTSSGIALNFGFNAGTNNTASNFIAISNSNTAVVVNSSSRVTGFKAFSTSGRAVHSTKATVIDNFYAVTGNNSALYYDTGSNVGSVTNGKCINNSTSDCAVLYNFGYAHNIEAINLGSGLGLVWGSNQASRPAEITNCKGISVGGIGGLMEAIGSGYATADNCEFVSRLNSSSGHALQVIGTQPKLLTKCNFRVTNSGANAINATSAVTVNSRYCTHNEVATTPINANVTIVSSGIIS